MQQHTLAEVRWHRHADTGRVVAVCSCGWKSLLTLDPIRSIKLHRNKRR